MTKRKGFSTKFNGEAVRLMESWQKPPPDLARELDVRRNQLYKWIEPLMRDEGGAFPGSGRKSASADEVARLCRKLERVKEEQTSSTTLSESQTNSSMAGLPNANDVRET